MTPQSLVEHALATSIADDCIVIVRDKTSANLRWANNTLTTNGVMHGIAVTVISFIRSADGVATGSVSGSASSQAQVTALVEAADAAARAGAPAEDANDLVRDRASDDWDDAPVHTDIHVYDAFAPALGEAFGRASGGGRVLYGFVNHELTTTYLGSTTGLRLRHVSRPGTTPAPARPRTSPRARGWAARPGTSPASTPSSSTPRSRSGSRGAPAASTCRPVATTRSCPPARWRT
jgi:predicted Zn-dependent protease